MRVCVQWSQATPGDWQEVDSADWHTLPELPPPDGIDGVKDQRKGWVHRLSIQGVEFTAEHYAVEHISDEEIRVTVWNDSSLDHPSGERFALVWTFKTLAPDLYFNGAINTRQTKVVYLDLGGALNDRWGDVPIQDTEFKDWSEFVPPDSIARHGILVSDDLNDQHNNSYTKRTWREWTEGIDPSELKNGKVKPQRSQGRYNIPDGTKTYYTTTTATATGIHVATHEKQLSDTDEASPTDISDTLGGGDSILFAAITTDAGEPGDDTWPTGDYRYQIDATTVGANITYGARTAGSANGHFARVNTGLTSDLETKAQTEALFSGTGLKLATTGSVSWTAGATSDRFEVLIAATRPANHGNQTFTMQIGESDDFADGPWAASSLTADAVAASGTGTANAATVTNAALTANAIGQTGTGTANAATVTNVALTANATAQTGTTTANAATVVNASLTANATLSIATGATNNATATLGTPLSANAVLTSATASVNATTVVNAALTANAVLSVGTSTANASTVVVGPALTANAPALTSTATANAAIVIKTIAADATVSSATGTANAATIVSVSLTANADLGSGSATANSAVAEIPITLNAPAEVVTASVDTQPALALLNSLAGLAQLASAKADQLFTYAVLGGLETGVEIANAKGEGLSAGVTKTIRVNAVVASGFVTANSIRIQKPLTLIEGDVVTLQSIVGEVITIQSLQFDATQSHVSGDVEV